MKARYSDNDIPWLFPKWSNDVDVLMTAFWWWCDNGRWWWYYPRAWWHYFVHTICSTDVRKQTACCWWWYDRWWFDVTLLFDDSVWWLMTWNLILLLLVEQLLHSVGSDGIVCRLSMTCIRRKSNVIVGNSIVVTLHCCWWRYYWPMTFGWHWWQVHDIALTHPVCSVLCAALLLNSIPSPIVMMTTDSSDVLLQYCISDTHCVDIVGIIEIRR